MRAALDVDTLGYSATTRTAPQVKVVRNILRAAAVVMALALLVPANTAQAQTPQVLQQTRQLLKTR